MFKDKLKELRIKHKVTQRDLSDMFNVSLGAVGNWETGKRMPDTEMLARIASKFNVSVDYLLGRESVSGELSFDNIFPITKKRFPLLGEIACGEPIFADEHRESYIVSGTDVEADFCLQAKGDSMMGARILDGDIVFIKSMSMVQNGEIAAVIIGDEATLKRVYYYPEKGKLILNAENPRYEPMVFEGEELNEIRILGKAVAFQTDVR